MLQQSGMPRGEGSARLQAESTYSGTEPLIASLIQAGRRSSPEEKCPQPGDWEVLAAEGARTQVKSALACSMAVEQ